jgi:hypothetical protein
MCRIDMSDHHKVAEHQQERRGRALKVGGDMGVVTARRQQGFSKGAKRPCKPVFVAIQRGSGMPKSERVRIDYMPGAAALQAIDIASAMFPDARPQALLDKLVITAVSVLAHKHWRAPCLHGSNRDQWKLPDTLRPDASRFSINRNQK